MQIRYYNLRKMSSVVSLLSVSNCEKLFFLYIHFVPVFIYGPEKEPDDRSLENVVGTSVLVYVTNTKHKKIIIVFTHKKPKSAYLSHFCYEKYFSWITVLLIKYIYNSDSNNRAFLPFKVF